MNAPLALTEQEEKLLYHIEVLGFNATRAGALVGIENPQLVLKKPGVQEVRDRMREAVRKKVDITKEDIINGFLKAIEQADLLGEPMTQIAGWERIAKILGFDKPKEVIVWAGDAKGVRRQIAQLPDADLVKLLEADNVIDAEFYVNPNS